MPDPMELSNLMTLPRGGDGAWTPNGTRFDAGMFVHAADGERMVYGRAGSQMIFISSDTRKEFAPKLGKYYSQDLTTFANDCDLGGYAQAGRRLMATQAVIKNFLDVFTGVVALAGGPVAWGIAGMNLAVTAGKIKNQYSSFANVMDLILYHHEFFTTKVPTFTSVLLGSFLAGVLENQAINYGKGLVSKAIPGAGGKVAGVILSQLGEDRMKVRFSALSTVLKDVLIKVAVHCNTHYPEKLSEEQIGLLANHVKFKICDTTKFEIVEIVRKQLVREVAANPLNLPSRFKAIADALDVIYG